ncbi:hypothetical protein JCM10207_007279 [Rhodosporidiobolus poonsookiae]
MPTSTGRVQRSILAVAALLVAVASAQPARFPCGTTSPNQHICDSLSRASATQKGLPVPVSSECIGAADGRGFFCGWTGARCTTDAQCDFGICSGEDGEVGVCTGGLGELCEGPEGPDDSLCQGNLSCQRRTDGVAGRAVCGGSGADCSFDGAYEPGLLPNNQACVSGYCDARTLTCAARPRAQPDRPQAFYRADSSNAQSRFERVPVAPKPPSNTRQRVAVPLGGASCPTGFTLCPVRAGLSSGGFEFACIDTTTSLTHCGGCPNIGAGFWNPGDKEGVDCMAVEGVASAACVDSKCRIFSCAANYEFNLKTGGCSPKKYW